MKLIRIRPPLPVVKLVCAAAAVAGFFFVVAGSLITGLCLLMGSILTEKNLLRCPCCNEKLDMTTPVSRYCRCPRCQEPYRPYSDSRK